MRTLPQPTPNIQKYPGGFGLVHWIKAVIRGAWRLEEMQSGNDSPGS